MRALILVAGAALSLAACGKNGQAGQATNASDSLTSENIVANDVTAIDAVTGDAANMAADVDINFTNQQVAASANNASERAARREQPSARPSTAPVSSNAAEPVAEPAANTTANTTQ